MSGRRPPGLGRGMAALMGDAANAPPGGGGVQSVPLEMLTPSPFQPRKSMDEGALAELAQSIRQRRSPAMI
jgi:ParB family chromosome partitioning protein